MHIWTHTHAHAYWRVLSCGIQAHTHTKSHLCARKHTHKTSVGPQFQTPVTCLVCICVSVGRSRPNRADIQMLGVGCAEQVTLCLGIWRIVWFQRRYRRFWGILQRAFIVGRKSVHNIVNALSNRVCVERAFTVGSKCVHKRGSSVHALSNMVCVKRAFIVSRKCVHKRSSPVNALSNRVCVKRAFTVGIKCS